ncbi:hypothetical protein FBPa8_0004 [Pseudomonas phage vB_PaeP_FBPa8]|nr:hypothetical protein FBPa8_0004 [Pseudomonas phage vB_PaeP_FBPa8]
MSTLRTDTLQTTDSSFTIDVEDIASQIYVDDKVSGATRSVSSVAALKTTMPEYDGQILILNGYYEDTPGVGGGLVRWDATSTLTPDDGLVIQRTDVPVGRYIRDVSQGIWAEMFGARNDGTDPEGTTNAVWAAIRAMRRDEVDVIHNNIEGLLIQTSQFTPSTTSQPTEQWLRILGCTGVLDSNTFSGPTSKVVLLANQLNNG